MLRRIRLAHSVTMTLLAGGQQPVARSLHLSHPLYNTSSSNNAANMSQEDKEELERERRLREKFAEKINQHIPNQGGSGSSSEGKEGSGKGDGSADEAQQARLTNFMRIMFFVTSIYMLILLGQLENPDSALSLFQGVPWWQLPPDCVAYYLLMRSLLSYSTQRTIQKEFAQQQKTMPHMTLSQFFQMKYPGIFQGHRTSQPELVAALSASFAIAHNRHFAEVVSNAAGSTRDTKQAVDNIMQALQRDFPGVFNPPAPAPVPVPAPVSGAFNSSGAGSVQMAGEGQGETSTAQTTNFSGNM